MGFPIKTISGIFVVLLIFTAYFSYIDRVSLLELPSGIAVLLCPLFFLITNLTVIICRKVYSIKWKYKWISLIAIFTWIPLGVLFILNPLVILFYPEFLYDPSKWGLFRAASIVIYLTSFILYFILKRKAFYLASCCIILAFTIELTHSLFFGSYSGP